MPARDLSEKHGTKNVPLAVNRELRELGYGWLLDELFQIQEKIDEGFGNDEMWKRLLYLREEKERIITNVRRTAKATGCKREAK